MKQIPSKKKHADFQSSYRRSLNFSHHAKNNKLVLKENGKLVLKSQSTEEE